MDNRPYALAIAGFDPTGGAGILADIKTMEALDVQGLAVLSARTVQTEDTFYSCQWERASQLFATVKTLSDRYPIKAVKIGIMPSSIPLMRLVRYLHTLLPEVPIVIDPVMHPSSADYTFIGNITMNFLKILHPTDLLTPNSIEYRNLIAPLFRHNEYPINTNILVTGGHETIGSSTITDLLYTPNGKYELQVKRREGSKHGTGCVFSSAIASFLARGWSLLDACREAQNIVGQYIVTSNTLLGQFRFQ